MNGKIIEVFCGLMLLLQASCVLVVQFRIVDPWFFPATVLFVVFTVFGGIAAVFGVGLWMMARRKQRRFRPDMIAIYFTCLFTVVYTQFTHGRHNFNLRASNDSSTDITNPPLYQLSKYQRLHIKEVSPVWGFMNIPHTIAKADTDSIVLSKSGLESKIIINQVANLLGWVMVRRSDNRSADKTFNETYELLAGNNGLGQRTNFVVRIVSNNEGFSVVDLRSSSPGRRRDFGLNELMIRNFAEELAKAVVKDQMTSLVLPKGLELL
tara:strand:+ start:1040 stop:1837 length:798 start_codon:yes stop_codon:yes gene_type:complete